MSEQLAGRLVGPGIDTQVSHRDLGRE